MQILLPHKAIFQNENYLGPTRTEKLIAGLVAMEKKTVKMYESMSASHNKSYSSTI